MIRACIIGYGGIAQAHKNAYFALEKEGIAKLVGAFDIEPGQFKKHKEINLGSSWNAGGDFRCYTNREEMLLAEQPDVVDICLPSYLHADTAVEMLERGYHVQSEKPMALTFADCRRMLDAANHAGRHLMIGQCLHFYSEYDYLKRCVEDKRFGKVLTAYFERLSSPPRWAWENWFLSYERSGGALTDLHVHDVDMIRYLFGDPMAVSCRAQSSISKYDSCFTDFYYPDGIPVTAVGDWALHGFRFRQAYRVCFEKARLEFENSGVTVFPYDEDKPWRPDLKPLDGIEGEIRYFAEVIKGKHPNVKNPPESAAETIRLIETMRISAEKGGEKIAFAEEQP